MSSPAPFIILPRTVLRRKQLASRARVLITKPRGVIRLVAFIVFVDRYDVDRCSPGVREVHVMPLTMTSASEPTAKTRITEIEFCCEK